MKPLLSLTVVAALATAHADPLRDPTRPPPRVVARATTPEAGPVLSAVFSSGDRRSAIFNGRLVKAGDSVGAFRIDEVLADGVRYRHGQTSRELYLPRIADGVKKPAVGTARGASGGQ